MTNPSQARADKLQRPSLISKARAMRSKLTWDEIREIEREWKDDDGMAKAHITKLIRMIRFQAEKIERLSGPLKRNDP